MDADKSAADQDPLALGAINERRLVAAVLEFLKTKSEKEETPAPVRENLDVARQCLTQAFDLTEDRIEILRPQMSLIDIFASHPDAAPSDPKRVLESELNRTPAATAEAKNKAEEHKNRGNDLMKNGQIDEALQAYSQALTLDPTNPILYCNRAAAYSKLNQHDLAAKDCEIALAFDSTYAKAYGRYGLALHGLGMLKEAKEALEKAVSLDESNQLYKNNLKLVEDAIAGSSGLDQGGAPGGFPGGFPGMGMGGMPGGLPSGMFDMLQNPDFQSSMMNMMQNPQVQQMISQFSGMFASQMGGGAQGGAPPNLNEMFQGGLQGLSGMTPEQIAAQMQGLFGGGPPPAGGAAAAPDAPGSQLPKGPEDKDKKDPPPPSYFS
ncbi:putative Small glutamine-rich tetratricopeptide repeat-containing protein alpha [Hypsibius exemplaris]|uniref:Small glutamine-rich tetratricopeptide repeat-containing protein alpha n=1 Tax=Hypsibius exemplaris TaxID=2072580 RepID=A0A1W0X0J0_HYPEX|nr:putative Small glutamine-rich tetratricopeptide repeat-containing protein alpha [Hypsibius exemplaris]